MARTLLQAGIGDAQDWQDSQGDAIRFMAPRTIERAAERFDRRAIDAVAHIHVSLGTNPVSLGWGDPEQDPDRVFLSVETSRISVIYPRPAFDLLATQMSGLPTLAGYSLSTWQSKRALAILFSMAGHWHRFKRTHGRPCAREGTSTAGQSAAVKAGRAKTASFC